MAVLEFLVDVVNSFMRAFGESLILAVFDQIGGVTGGWGDLFIADPIRMTIFRMLLSPLFGPFD